MTPPFTVCLRMGREARRRGEAIERCPFAEPLPAAWWRQGWKLDERPGRRLECVHAGRRALESGFDCEWEGAGC